MIMEMFRWVRVFFWKAGDGVRLIRGTMDDLRFRLRRLCSHLGYLVAYGAANANSFVRPVDRTSRIISIW